MNTNTKISIIKRALKSVQIRFGGHSLECGIVFVLEIIIKLTILGKLISTFKKQQQAMEIQLSSPLVLLSFLPPLLYSTSNVKKWDPGIR